MVVSSKVMNLAFYVALNIVNNSSMCVFMWICSLTMCSWRANAAEAVYEIDTGSSIEAGLRVAFIHIILTVHPLVAWFAL